MHAGGQEFDPPTLHHCINEARTCLTGSSFYIREMDPTVQTGKRNKSYQKFILNYKSVRKYGLTSKLTRINWVKQLLKQWELLYRSTRKTARKDNGHVVLPNINEKAYLHKNRKLVISNMKELSMNEKNR